MKSRSFILLSILLVCLVAVFTFSCGGGGGSSSGSGTGSTTPSQSPANIDADTGAEALAMLDTTLMISENFQDLEFSSMATGEQASGPSILTPVMKLFFNSGAGFQALGTEKDKEDCEYGGTMAWDFTWDGDDDADECEMQNLHGTVTLTSCKMSPDSNINGVLEISSTGQVCKPSSIKAHYINYYVMDESAGISVSAPDFTIAITDFAYDKDDDLSGYKMTFNGKLSVTYDGEQYTVECSNLVFNSKWTDSQTVLSINGMISGPCLDGWVTITTNQQIVIPEGSGDDTCPIAGQLTISGKGQIILKFNSDGSVDIGDQHYDSCDDLPVDGC